jgi:hypothetical protein
VNQEFLELLEKMVLQVFPDQLELREHRGRLVFRGLPEKEDYQVFKKKSKE